MAYRFLIKSYDQNRLSVLNIIWASNIDSASITLNYIKNIYKINMKYKPSVLKNIFLSLKNGATISDACRAAGITRVTFFNWYRDKPKFAEKVENLKMSRVSFVEDALYKGAIGGNFNSQQFILKNKSDWVDKTIQEKNINVTVKDIAEKADSVRRRFADIEDYGVVGAESN